jgi:hypothetical protein
MPVGSHITSLVVGSINTSSAVPSKKLGTSSSITLGVRVGDGSGSGT